MDIKRFLRHFAPLFLLFFPIGIIVVLCLTGIAEPFINTFDVDSFGCVYVGKSEIEVYSDGKCIRTISPKTSRAYKFEILGNVIILSDYHTVYTMDLYGNILDFHEDINGQEATRLSNGRFRRISENGDQYAVLYNAGRARITKNQTDIVYKEPVIDAVTNISMWVLIPVFMILTGVLVVKYHIENKTDTEKLKVLLGRLGIK